ncbi:MAG: amidohydrolase [Planctomycetes bacterium]|nr:amidohydrolase [Planctomycetota bacterium]
MTLSSRVHVWFRAAVLCWFTTLPVSIFAQAPESRPAETVFLNGAVYTVDASRSWAEAVVIRDGKIVYVGTTRGASPWIGPQTKTIDLQGKMLLPGFHDAHVHLVGGGIELGECDLNGLTKLEDILAAVRKYAAEHPHKKWIRGGGWPLTLQKQIHKSQLDQIVPDRPVHLDAADGHSSWDNSLALAAAKITRETPQPARGRIEHDPQTGEPTGVLREAAAFLVADEIPPHSPEEYQEGLRRGLKLANRLGITSVCEARVTDRHLEAFAALEKRGELTVRAVCAMGYTDSGELSEIAKFVDWRKKYQGRRFRATAVKIFEDGVIESKTAALLEPYLGGDKPEMGWLNVEPDVLNPLVAQLDKLGFQVKVHAIGDRGIRATLDAFEFARNRNGTRDSRHHIAHIQMFHPADIPRFRQLGVVANFQPLWAYADPYIMDLTIPIIGVERARFMYPIRSLAKSGAVVVCGSDWSVSSMNPLEAIQIGITRRGLKDGPGPGWLPDEMADLPLLLAGYTINAAYVNFQESETGSIEPGKAADLVVLDRNLFEIPAHEIHRAQVLLTLLDGQEVYRAEKADFLR